MFYPHDFRKWLLAHIYVVSCWILSFFFFFCLYNFYHIWSVLFLEKKLSLWKSWNYLVSKWIISLFTSFHVAFLWENKVNKRRESCCKEINDCFPFSFRARLTLPSNLVLLEHMDSSLTVVTQQVIPNKTQFGPFEARRTTQDLDAENIFNLKVCSSHFSLFT